MTTSEKKAETKDLIQKNPREQKVMKNSATIKHALMPQHKDQLTETHPTATNYVVKPKAISQKESTPNVKAVEKEPLPSAKKVIKRDQWTKKPSPKSLSYQHLHKKHSSLQHFHPKKNQAHEISSPTNRNLLNPTKSTFQQESTSVNGILTYTKQSLTAQSSSLRPEEPLTLNIPTVPTLPSRTTVSELQEGSREPDGFETTQRMIRQLFNQLNY